MSVIGTGHMEVMTGAGLAETGHRITFVGRNQEKLDLIRSGQRDPFEQDLDELLERNGRIESS